MRRCFAPFASLCVVSIVACAFSGACGYSENGTGLPDAEADGSGLTPEAGPSSSGAPDGSGPQRPVCVPAALDFNFSMSAPYTTVNTGVVAPGATGRLTTKGAFPAFVAMTPSGAFAPFRDTMAIDFGTATTGATGDAGRALDFPQEVTAATEGVNAFTITGWLNLRSLDNGGGGNRIISTHKDGTGTGFDLVQDNNNLRLGVNDSANGGSNPPKGGDKLTADPNLAPTNWIYFAVVYDAKVPATNNDGTVTFYLGSPAVAAVLDKTAEYDQGAVKMTAERQLTVGNVITMQNGRGDDGNGSRIPRGMIDELRFFAHALTLADIQCHQRR